jgi:hypothetical protein
MPLRLYSTVLAAKVETAEGTPETLTNAEAMLVQKLTFNPTQEQYERDVLRGTLSRIPSVSGKRQAKISFEVEMRGSGAVATAPDYGPLLKGCGYTETITPSTGPVVYKPGTSGLSNSLTIGLYFDGVLHKIQGARGNVKFTMENGKPGIMAFEFTGADYVTTDVAILTGMTYPTVVPGAFLSAALLVDTYAAICSKVEIDTGNKVELRESMNSASGFLSAIITGRLPKGTMDVEQPLVAGYDFFLKWKTPGTLGSLSLATAAATGNGITVTCPKVRWSGIKPADKTGLRTLGMDFEPCLSTADDEISISII